MHENMFDECPSFGCGINHKVDDNAAVQGCRADDPEMREAQGTKVHDSIAHHFFLRDCSRGHRFNEMGCILTAREQAARPKLAGWFPRPPPRQTGTKKSANALVEQARNQRFDPLLRMGTVMTGRTEQWDRKDAADSARRIKLANTVGKIQAFKNSYPALRWTKTGYLAPANDERAEEGGCAQPQSTARSTTRSAARGHSARGSARSGGVSSRSSGRVVNKDGKPRPVVLPPPVDDRDWVLQPTAHPPRHDREGFLKWSAGGAVEAPHEPTPRWTTTNMSMSRAYARPPRSASARAPPRPAAAAAAAPASARPSTAVQNSARGGARASPQRPRTAAVLSGKRQQQQLKQQQQEQRGGRASSRSQLLMSMRSRRDDGSDTQRSLRQSKQALQARLREVDAMLAQTSCFSARSAAVNSATSTLTRSKT